MLRLYHFNVIELKVFGGKENYGELENRVLKASEKVARMHGRKSSELGSRCGG